jgi:hypothetical protein
MLVQYDSDDIRAWKSGRCLFLFLWGQVGILCCWNLRDILFIGICIDLGKIFPVSPDKMSQPLFVIEVTGLRLSIPLTLLSFMSASMLESANDHFELTAPRILLLLLVATIGTGIVIFATKVTMKK